MNNLSKRPACTVLVFVCLCLTACVFGTSKPTRFFMLSPAVSEGPEKGPVMEGRSVRLMVEPVEIPRYLNRPQIVTLEDGVEYRLDDFNAWLEPLGDNLTRVIGENLSLFLGAEGIGVVTSSRSAAIDFRVAVSIVRMDGKLGRHADLKGEWSLTRPGVNGPLTIRQSVYRETLNDDSYQAFVTAQNRMVESLSRDIAKAVGPLARTCIKADK